MDQRINCLNLLLKLYFCTLTPVFYLFPVFSFVSEMILAASGKTKTTNKQQQKPTSDLNVALTELTVKRREESVSTAENRPGTHECNINGEMSGALQHQYTSPQSQY